MSAPAHPPAAAPGDEAGNDYLLTPRQRQLVSESDGARSARASASSSASAAMGRPSALRRSHSSKLPVLNNPGMTNSADAALAAPAPAPALLAAAAQVGGRPPRTGGRSRSKTLAPSNQQLDTSVWKSKGISLLDLRQQHRAGSMMTASDPGGGSGANLMTSLVDGGGGRRGGGGGGAGGAAGAMSLQERLSAQQEIMRRADAARGAGKMVAGTAIKIGEKVDVYSESAGAWVPGAVTKLLEGGREVKVRYTLKTPGGGTDTREKAVAIISSELRRRLDDSAAKGGTAGGGGGASAAGLPGAQRWLTLNELKRAQAALLRVPAARSVDSIRELVDWTQLVDLFYGLSPAERQQLCQEVAGERLAEDTKLTTGGEPTATIHVLFSGEAALYAMRPQKTAAQEDLKTKFGRMQRRVSVAVRANAMAATEDDDEKDVARRRASVAVAMFATHVKEEAAHEGEQAKQEKMRRPASSEQAADQPTGGGGDGRGGARRARSNVNFMLETIHSPTAGPAAGEGLAGLPTIMSIDGADDIPDGPPTKPLEKMETTLEEAETEDSPPQASQYDAVNELSAWLSTPTEEAQQPETAAAESVSSAAGRSQKVKMTLKEMRRQRMRGRSHTVHNMTVSDPGTTVGGSLQKMGASSADQDPDGPAPVAGSAATASEPPKPGPPRPTAPSTPRSANRGRRRTHSNGGETLAAAVAVAGAGAVPTPSPPSDRPGSRTCRSGSAPRASSPGRVSFGLGGGGADDRVVRGDGRNGFPVRVGFSPCDAVGAVDAFNNQSSELVTSRGVGKLCKAEHTTLALEDGLVAMVIDKPEHLVSERGQTRLLKTLAAPLSFAFAFG
eukprot:SAG22_NODE_428_length_10591_cov_8.858178_10_plen_842_part_00